MNGTLITTAIADFYQWREIRLKQTFSLFSLYNIMKTSNDLRESIDRFIQISFFIDRIKC